MKRTLLLFLFLTLSISVFPQVQGPPPPLGYIIFHKCDLDGDGYEVFNLSSHFIFPFNIPGEEASNYQALTFYLSAEERDNEINPIMNASAYVNTSDSQPIYYRTYAIVPGAYQYLDGDSKIIVEAIPSPNSYNSLVICDTNAGINFYNLSLARDQILSGQNSELYSLGFYKTMNDAENETNIISNITSYSNSVNQEIIYVRFYHFYAPECYVIVELNLEVQDDCGDIEVYLVSNTLPRPGFNYRNYLGVKNNSLTKSISGRVEFTYDSLLNFDSISFLDVGNTIEYTPNGFILDFNNLLPNRDEILLLDMNIPVSVNLGDSFTNIATYLGSDTNPNNNISILREVIVGSYDPNDIAESHGPEIFYDDFTSDDYLFYTIRFQNVGTADAINVSIDNTLDAGLDKSTIQMLAASHDYVFTRTDNQLNWKFDNIHLPSESMNEPNSHGYVYYKIKPTAGFQVGDIIPNTAEIYFDFNPAVITNTFETEFVATLSNESFSNANYSMFPNPANNFVEIKFSKSTSNKIQLGVYDIQGKLILEDKRELQNNATMLDISNFKSGMYFIKVNDGIGETTQKLIIY